MYVETEKLKFKKFGNFVCLFFENTLTLRQAKNINSNEQYVSRQNLTNS